MNEFPVNWVKLDRHIQEIFVWSGEVTRTTAPNTVIFDSLSFLDTHYKRRTVSAALWESFLCEVTEENPLPVTGDSDHPADDDRPVLQVNSGCGPGTEQPLHYYFYTNNSEWNCSIAPWDHVYIFRFSRIRKNILWICIYRIFNTFVWWIVASSTQRFVEVLVSPPL